jgi:hypothetical protein
MPRAGDPPGQRLRRRQVRFRVTDEHLRHRHRPPYSARRRRRMLTRHDQRGTPHAAHSRDAGRPGRQPKTVTRPPGRVAAAEWSNGGTGACLVR